MIDFNVSISPKEAMKIINEEIINGSFTGERVDKYITEVGDGRMVGVLVYEKHYYRAGNRLTLTVVVDNLNSTTHIHAVGGGGGEGLLSFDWGAADDFESCVKYALNRYKIK